MLSGPFDILGLFDQAKEAVFSNLPEYGGGIAFFAAAAVIVRLGIKALAGRSSGTKNARAPDAPEPPADAPASDSDSSARESADSAEKEKEEEKQKEIERDIEREKLKELFELFDEGKDKPEELEKTGEDKELEELGLDRQELKGLKEQYKELVNEITSLLEQGLTASQAAKSLISRTAEQIPVMELRPLIEAMGCFLKQNKEVEKTAAVIGHDPALERKAGLNALKRGDYEEALGFLERRAAMAENRARTSRREDIRGKAMEDAAGLYRAAAVVLRPSEPEKSFGFLKKSNECIPAHPLTETMMARAYYESGKTKKAEKLFCAAMEHGERNDYAVRYAARMVPQIRTERTMLHAARIRENYEKRLEDVEGRQLISRNLIEIQKQKKTVSRFVLEEMRERSAERVNAG